MIDKLFIKIHKLCDYYKQHGFLKLCKYIYTSLFDYDKFVIFEKDLSVSFEEVRAKIQVNMRLLSSQEKDIVSLVEFWPDFYAPPYSTPELIRELIINRLSNGEECIIVEYEGKIIAMNWLGYQNTHLFNSYVMIKRIGLDEALFYNIYCAPECRGNDIFAVLISEMSRLLKARCYKKLIGYVNPHNYASIKVCTKMFGKPIQMLRCLYIFGFRLSFLSRGQGG